MGRWLVEAVLRFNAFSFATAAHRPHNHPPLDAPIPLPLAEDYDFEEDPDSLLQDTDREAAMDDNDDDDDPQFTGSTAAAKAPCLLFGFDGWDGSARPFVTPLFPGEEAGTWAASVHLPNYARRLDCAVSDGDLAFDTNGGAYYHLLVTHVQRLSADGVTVETYRQAADGVLTPTGVLEVNDAQELERMIEEELDQRHRGGGNGGAEAFAADVAGLPLLGQEDEDAAEEEPDLVDTAPALASESFGGGEEARRLAASGATGVPLSAQAAERAGSIQQLRAEAGVVGERVGLSSIMINEVREAFDGELEEGGTPLAYEGLGAAVLGMEAAGRALARLGLDGFGAVEVEALCARVLGREGPVSLEGLMRLFQALDEEDCGISMV